jgi:hypothetical protein
MLLGLRFHSWAISPASSNHRFVARRHSLAATVAGEFLVSQHP